MLEHLVITSLFNSSGVNSRPQAANSETASSQHWDSTESFTSNHSSKEGIGSGVGGAETKQNSCLMLLNITGRKPFARNRGSGCRRTRPGRIPLEHLPSTAVKRVRGRSSPRRCGPGTGGGRRGEPPGRSRTGERGGLESPPQVDGKRPRPRIG